MLLVEDAPPIRELLQLVLAQESGVQLLNTSSAHEALELLLAMDGMPELVIVDPGVADLVVDTFLRTVRRRFGPDLPVMILCTPPEDQVDEMVRRVQAHSAVVKPFELLHLVREVRRIVRQR